MRIKAFILLSTLSFFVFAQIPPGSKPRQDLYQKIEKTTGISLKEAYQAIFIKKKIVARNKLLRYGNAKKIKDITRGYIEEIENHEKRCKTEKEVISCKEQVLDLKEQLNFISNLDKEIAKS